MIYTKRKAGYHMEKSDILTALLLPKIMHLRKVLIKSIILRSMEKKYK